MRRNQMEETMSHFKPRGDAIWLQNPQRLFVPTVYGEREGNTRWVNSWPEFEAAGGCQHFNEDQTEIVLTLPDGWKFAIGFQGRTVDPRKTVATNCCTTIEGREACVRDCSNSRHPFIRLPQWDKTGNVWHVDIDKVGRYSIQRTGHGPYRAKLNNILLASLGDWTNIDAAKATIEQRIREAMRIGASDDLPPSTNTVKFKDGHEWVVTTMEKGLAIFEDGWRRVDDGSYSHHSHIDCLARIREVGRA